MKAFGVRLAAGAVTVAMGAIMAAQAQKDQQPGTDSAWTEEQIPPGQAVSPIGSADALVSTEAWDTEVFKPIGDAPSPDAASGGGVALVQHTEPTGAMALPTNPPDVDAKGEAAESSGSRAPLMTMSLPNFDDAPPLDTQPAADTAASSPPGAGGPSVLMGLPMAETPPSSVPDKPKLSEIKFADTPVTEFDQQADVGDAAQGNPLASDLPANDLRGGVGMPDAIEASGPTSRSSQPDPNFLGGPEVTDAAAGAPAALLTPVLSGGEQTELAEGSESTMRIHREPPVQLKIGAEPNAQQSAAVPSATMGITSQPQIVGQYDQPVGGAEVHGPPQAVGGFAAPANNGLANQSDSLGSQSSAGLNASALAVPALAVPALAVPALSVPALPSSAGSTSTFDAPPMQSQATQQPATPSFAGVAPTSGDASFQGVGYKQSGGDRPLPAGPTMASPGERYLDGPQAPSIVIHKRAPAEVKVGKPASFVITVKNVGGSKALDVNVHDRVPTGMTLTDATPRPNPKFQPELFWELGDLEPNQERTITLQLTPEQEGELGSVARVTFQAAASVRTISTRPELKIAQKAPEKVLIGQQLEIELEVSNPGTGEATGVILQEDVPAGLEHPQGGKLDNLIGTLGPGEIRRQILRMRAIKPGIVQNQIRVKGDDGLETTHTVAVEVIAPELKVSLTGPSRRYLERQATYNLELANVGTADATNVELSVQLDRGFTFVKTDFEGQYDPARHAVFWSLPALPVGQSGKVPLTLLPVEEGDRVLRTEATADLGIKTSTDSEVRVESLAELSFSINDSADPIEVGGETTYEIRITNSGSKDDTNVNVAMQLPQGLKLVEQGDFTPQGQGIIKFSPRALLKANDEMVYQVKAQGVTPGRYLVKAIVTSDQSNVPVTKEESIMVYSDQ